MNRAGSAESAGGEVPYVAYISKLISYGLCSLLLSSGSKKGCGPCHKAESRPWDEAPPSPEAGLVNRSPASGSSLEVMNGVT